jgi:hypothetical protein
MTLASPGILFIYNFSTSQWYHVAAVCDGTNSILNYYLNGNMVASTSAPGAIASDTSLLPGRDPRPQSKYLKEKLMKFAFSM